MTPAGQEPGLTSADRDGEVPHGHIGSVGHAGELGVAVQHVARHAAVADFVSHVEASVIIYSSVSIFSSFI